MLVGNANDIEVCKNLFSFTLPTTFLPSSVYHSSIFLCIYVLIILKNGTLHHSLETWLFNLTYLDLFMSVCTNPSHPLKFLFSFHIWVNHYLPWEYRWLFSFPVFNTKNNISVSILGLKGLTLRYFPMSF